MKKERVGYDLDGVICEVRDMGNVSYRRLNGAQRREYIVNKINHYKNAKVLNRPIERRFYIITGRTEKYAQLTIDWLRENNIVPIKLFINMVGGRTQDHIKHKLDTINELKITKYYEDSKRVYSKLKKECKHTEIIYVENGEIR